MHEVNHKRHHHIPWRLLLFSALGLLESTAVALGLNPWWLLLILVVLSLLLVEITLLNLILYIHRLIFSGP